LAGYLISISKVGTSDKFIGTTKNSITSETKLGTKAYEFQLNKYDINCPQTAYKNMAGDKEEDPKSFIETQSMS
jgi:hypothetical protein